MSAQIAAYRRPVADPRAIETRSMKATTAARLAANVECRDGSGETGEETLWLSVLAFGRVAKDFARHAKGDPVSVSGRVRLERYVAGDGEERETWRVLADSVVSSRSVRLQGGRRKGGASRQDRDGHEGHDWRELVGGPAPSATPAATSALADFDDDIPF